MKKSRCKFENNCKSKGIKCNTCKHNNEEDHYIPLLRELIRFETPKWHERFGEGVFIIRGNLD